MTRMVTENEEAEDKWIGNVFEWLKFTSWSSTIILIFGTFVIVFT